MPFSVNRTNNISSPKHVISPHKISASQFQSSDAYKSRIKREIQSHIIVNNKENISSIEPKVINYDKYDNRKKNYMNQKVLIMINTIIKQII